MTQHIPAQGATDPNSGAASQPLPPNSDPLLRERARFAFTGISRSAWYAAMRAGKAPKPLRFGARTVAWRASDLQKWADSLDQHKAAQ